SRAQSMKSCATGATVRCFNVMMLMNPGFVGKSMGRALIDALQPANLTADSEVIVRNRPLATRAIRATLLWVNMVARGRSSPALRKESAAHEPGKLSGGANVHGSFTRSLSVTLRR